MSKTELKTTVRSFQIDPAVWKRLKRAAVDHDVTMSYLLRRFIREGLDRLESKAGLKL